ncbi:CHAD domain-containing protein [Proteiniclasticum sp.]|uniref:CHAD domain-containing protein n=1 Tax=Proteiniclasticum sp. TaxID=2053595 RepID=UPI00289EF42D|nr:CHAD domain-containing protein [Proteiniclasticum sp.]
MEHKVIGDFRRHVRIIFLELDELLFKLKLNGENEDMEKLVHEIRVNFRRLISLLYFHKTLIRKKPLKRLNEDIELLLRSFAADRTGHVLMKNIERYDKEGEHGRILKAIVEREMALKKQIDRHHLDPLSFRVTYEGTLKTLLGFGREIFRRNSSQCSDILAFSINRYKEMMEELKHLEDTVNFEKKRSIHRLRVAAKNIYYTLESRQESLGELAVRRAAYLKEIQNIAGKIHDADVNLKILSELNLSEEENNVLEGFLDHLSEERKRKVSDLKELIHPDRREEKESHS